MRGPEALGLPPARGPRGHVRHGHSRSASLEQRCMMPLSRPSAPPWRSGSAAVPWNSAALRPRGKIVHLPLAPPPNHLDCRSRVISSSTASQTAVVRPQWGRVGPLTLVLSSRRAARLPPTYERLMGPPIMWPLRHRIDFHPTPPDCPACPPHRRLVPHFRFPSGLASTSATLRVPIFERYARSRQSDSAAACLRGAQWRKPAAWEAPTALSLAPLGHPLGPQLDLARPLSISGLSV